jgi:hypothetical protein
MHRFSRLTGSKANGKRPQYFQSKLRGCYHREAMQPAPKNPWSRRRLGDIGLLWSYLYKTSSVVY